MSSFVENLKHTLHKTVSEKDIMEHHTFKVVRRALMEDFPWIKNVFIKNGEYGLIRGLELCFDVDPYLMSELYGVPVCPCVDTCRDNNLPLVGGVKTFIGTDKVYSISNDLICLIESVAKVTNKLPLGIHFNGIGTLHYNRTERLIFNWPPLNSQLINP